MTPTNDRPDNTSVQADISGRQLGDFRLLRKLGHGAMADVYLAEQRLLRRRVAVKVLKRELADDQTYLKRFELEAQAAASLVHANIVQIYEVGHVDRLHYIAQEYVQGQNLLEWIARNSPVDLPHALSIMRQVAAALAKAADHGVVHRDIKPENIMLTRSGEVKVADFGLARVTRQGEAPGLTQVGVTMGTPLYMSPEQVEGKPFDHRSDIYSFGVTCYHLLAGSPPFTSETALGVAVQHVKKQPRPLEKARPDLPAALCRLVHEMLEKNPKHRCQSARGILRDLRRLHMEHFEDDWPEDLPDWQSTGIEMASDPRSQLTEQLDGLMKTVGMQRAGLRAVRLFWSGIAGTFLLGAIIAWFTARPPWLLADAQAPPPSVPRRETALRQYLDASRIGTEEAWCSLIEYHPTSSYVVLRGKQELARIYLRDGKYDRALELFEEVAASDEKSKALRACGLAGQIGVLTIQGEDRKAALVLEQLRPIRRSLRDRDMKLMLGYAVRKIHEKLQEKSAREWKEFLADVYLEDG